MGNDITAELKVLSPAQTQILTDQEGVYSLNHSDSSSRVEGDDVRATIFLNPEADKETEKAPSFFNFILDWQELDTANEETLMRPVVRQRWLNCSDSSCLEEVVAISGAEEDAEYADVTSGMDLNHLLERAGLATLRETDARDESFIWDVYAGYIDDDDTMDVMVVLSNGASLLYSQRDSD